MAGTNLSNNDAQLGPGLIGCFVTLIFFGILSSQCFAYYKHFKIDTKFHQSLVAVVWIIEAVSVAMMCRAAYWYLVTNYGAPNPFALAHWSLVATLMLNILIAFIVQAYFTLRIFDLSSRSWILMISIGVLDLAHAAAGMVNVIILFINRNIGPIDSLTLSAAVPWAAFSVASDIAVTGALCWLLSEKKTGIKQTNSIITTLMIYAINRSVLTCAFAILEVLMFVVFPNSLGFIGVDLVIGKLYANSLLATLNARHSLRKRDQNNRGTVVSTIRFGSSPREIPVETAEMFGLSIADEEVMSTHSPAIHLSTNSESHFHRRSNRLENKHEPISFTPFATNKPDENPSASPLA